MITVVIPVSPIPSHPSAEVLFETWDSIRHHLPDAEIILTFDGVRAEQEEMRSDYEEFIAAALWRAAHDDGHVMPLIFDRHTHQVGMMRSALTYVNTPLVMYVEQDTPLVTDRPIDWQLITEYVTSSESDLVRLYHEETVPEPHRHLMHNRQGHFLRTAQWSQRPHVATVEYYHLALSSFTDGATAFIEDKMHSVVQCALDDGTWDKHRLHIYDPEGNGQDMLRTYHLDGRAGGQKYDDSQVF